MPPIIYKFSINSPLITILTYNKQLKRIFFCKHLFIPYFTSSLLILYQLTAYYQYYILTQNIRRHPARRNNPPPLPKIFMSSPQITCHTTLAMLNWKWHQLYLLFKKGVKVKIMLIFLPDTLRNNRIFPRITNTVLVYEN